ncbi:hypothetical protein BJF85_07330 [Saccharomonospora sp. CUA-673]|uniref:hypothetical protein n=1 Tax=Saccharomonospora sp. CUA-673 TaxID=1904969 RepID=UPI000966D120|nr:hypothetical protein [Saccharomonospora sp. CUA-673]OLT39028.1 hypothetical protein BJF85_07330 [Saccharomonospora sp. CUA-673]
MNDNGADSNRNGNSSNGSSGDPAGSGPAGRDDSVVEDSVVGDELRRLFHGHEFGAATSAVPVLDTATIVAGARRRRRRRTAVTAAAGAVAVVGVLSAGVALSGVSGMEGGRGDREVIAADRSDTPTGPGPTGSGPADPTSAPSDGADAPSDADSPSPDGDDPTDVDAPDAPGSRPTAPSTPTSGDSPAPSSPDESFETEPFDLPGPAALGPVGKSPLSLGMTYAEAVETGTVDEGSGPPAAGQCSTFAVSDPAISRVAIRGGHGIVRFQAASAQTPEGIAVGSPRESLHQVYGSSLESSGENTRIKRNPDSSSRYVFTLDGDRVGAWRLTVLDTAAAC